MKHKFFGTIFGRRKTVVPKRQDSVGDFKSIKPARDITEFEYPPESSFYKSDIAETPLD